jgi:hypothetical protein
MPARGKRRAGGPNWAVSDQPQQKFSCSSDAAVVLVLSGLCLALFSVSFKLTLKLLGCPFSQWLDRFEASEATGEWVRRLSLVARVRWCRFFLRFVHVSPLSRQSAKHHKSVAHLPFSSRRPCGRARHEADVWPGPRSLRCEEVRQFTSLGVGFRNESVRLWDSLWFWAQLLSHFCLLR